VLLKTCRCLSRFLSRFKHVTCVQQYYCLPPDVSVLNLIISTEIFRITQHHSKLKCQKVKELEQYFQKKRQIFPCRIENYGETKVVEDCWALTQAAVRSCCGRSGSSVVGQLNFDWRWTLTLNLLAPTTVGARINP